MRQGFAAMSTVLIISAVALAVVTTTTLLSIGLGQSSLALLKSEGNLLQVEGCVEDVLQGIWGSPTFNSSSITRPEGTCTINYTSGGPTNWDVTVTSIAGDYARKIKVVLVRNSTSISLTSWQEI